MKTLFEKERNTTKEHRIPEPYCIQGPCQKWDDSLEAMSVRAYLRFLITATFGFALFCAAATLAFADNEKPKPQHDGSQFCAFYAEPVRAVDGDTLDVRPLSASLCTDASKEILDSSDDPTSLEPLLRIRLLAVGTPEYKEDGYNEAKQFTKRWLKKNKRVAVLHSADENGRPSNDRYGRLVAIVAPNIAAADTPLANAAANSLNIELLDSFHAEPLMLYTNRTMAILNGLLFQASERAAKEYPENKQWIPTYIRY